MKLVTYDRGDRPRAGVAIAGMIADLEKGARASGAGKLPASVRELLEGGAKAMTAARRFHKAAERLLGGVASGKGRRPAWAYPEDRVHLGPPVPNPEKILCLGGNYMDHCKEAAEWAGREVKKPANPVVFAVFPTTLTGPYDPIKLPATRITQKVDYEVEMAVVLGARVKGVKAKDAMAAVAGYMVLNDVSARDCQFGDGQWVRAKSFDTFAPCGPFLVTPDEVPDPHRLNLWTVHNGQTVQKTNTRKMIFKIPKLISFLSEAITFKPGDILSTGTPGGVGVFRDPPILLQPGDVVECGVEGVGTIINTCERA